MPEAQVQTTTEQRMKILAEALWNDSELGAKVQAKAKELFPDAKTNADVIDPLLNPLRKQNEKLAEDLKALRDEREAERRAADEGKTKQALQTQLDAARGEYHLSEDGYNAMIDRMKETNNFTDASAAAAWVVSKAPPVSPKGPTFATKRANFFGVGKYDEKMKDLHADPVGFMDSELEEWACDPDRYVSETLGAAA